MRRRSGFSLIEMMISVTLLLVIMSASVQFLRRQSNAVAMDSQRMDALQNAQFAASQVERELREAGVGISDEQPMIVQMDKEAITFNANLVSMDPQDVRAVYRTTDAEADAVRAMLPPDVRPLPNSNPPRTYPDDTYYAGAGVQSSAETISFYLTRDSAATTADTYALWRRVNARPATLVARNLLKDARNPVPFFTYYTQNPITRELVPVDAGQLPAYHVNHHGAVNDVGTSALTDAIRVVRVRFMAITVDPRAGADSLKYRAVGVKVRLMNAGLVQASACGARPAPTSPPTAVEYAPAPGEKAVRLTWARAGDDAGGEKDIERYAIFRRVATSPDNGDPIASVPANGTAFYSYSDRNVQPGASYVYGVAAQDCTPKVSDIALSSAVTISP